MDSDLQFCSCTDFKSYMLEFEDYFGKLRSSTDYELIKRIGDGASSLVHKARLRSDNRIFAIKRPRRNKYEHKLDKEEFRELTALKTLSHDNVIKLYDVIIGSNHDELSLVLEYCAYPLDRFIDLYPQKEINLSEVKSISQQMLRGLRYLHNNFIIHRDLKVSNLMIHESGILKIIDLGTCRHYSCSNTCMSPGVGTRFYKSPEILFEAPSYEFPVDIWSAGCVIAETFLRKPLFPGQSDIQMINLIVDLLGSPNQQNWPAIKHCKLFKSKLCFKTQNFARIRERYHDTMGDTLIDLLCGIFVYNPEDRLTADDCLNCDWLQTAPLPAKKIEIFPELIDDL